MIKRSCMTTLCYVERDGKKLRTTPLGQAVNQVMLEQFPDIVDVTFSADMLFNFDKSTLKDEGKAVLDDLVSRLAGVNVEVILSTGYADRLGKDAYNEKLSAARAESVKTYLVSKGVDANLIQTEGRGEADPVVDCPNPSAKGQVKNFRELVQCLAPNRRAVVEVVGTRQ